MKAEIITIGDEILIGQIVDTNSAWMATELNNIGIKVAQITSISDDPDHITEALNSAKTRADIILITGGLGPTKDDLTKKVLAKYFNSELIVHQPTLEHVTDFFARRNKAITPINKDQALVPACCKVLFNKNGTAPGMWFEDQGKFIISMPGVPFEMKGLMRYAVLPKLTTLNGIQKIVHKTVLTIGIGESFLADQIEEWENSLPVFIKLAYLPAPGQVRLRLSAIGEDQKLLELAIKKEIEKLKTIIPDAIFGYDQQNLAAAVGELLTQKGLTLASAESCTGGKIAESITSNAGSSKYFKGSVVAYSNEVKQHVLKVNENDLNKFGAVSEQVVKQMASGVQKLLKTDYAVATSGIAGPDGGTNDKPVGTVWMAIATPDKVIAQKMNYANNRERNILRSTQDLLNLLRLELLKNK